MSTPIYLLLLTTILTQWERTGARSHSKIATVLLFIVLVVLLIILFYVLLKYFKNSRLNNYDS